MLLWLQSPFFVFSLLVHEKGSCMLLRLCYCIATSSGVFFAAMEAAQNVRRMISLFVLAWKTHVMAWRWRKISSGILLVRRINQTGWWNWNEGLSQSQETTQIEPIDRKQTYDSRTICRHRLHPPLFTWTAHDTNRHDTPPGKRPSLRYPKKKAEEGYCKRPTQRHHPRLPIAFAQSTHSPNPAFHLGKWHHRTSFSVFESCTSPAMGARTVPRREIIHIEPRALGEIRYITWATC